jgi:hypothetical protein
VPVEIDLRIRDPDRMVQIERHAQRAPLQRLDPCEAPREIDLRRREAPRLARALTEERDLERVLGFVGPFVVDELGVETRHSLHVDHLEAGGWGQAIRKIYIIF